MARVKTAMGTALDELVAASRAMSLASGDLQFRLVKVPLVDTDKESIKQARARLEQALDIVQVAVRLLSRVDRASLAPTAHQPMRGMKTIEHLANSVIAAMTRA